LRWRKVRLVAEHPDPLAPPPEVRLPLTVAISEKGERWPGKPTLWQRFIRRLKRRS